MNKFITVILIVLLFPFALNAKVVKGEFFFSKGKSFEIKDTVDLQGRTIKLRPGSKISCDGGVLQNGQIEVSKRCKIIGNHSTWTRVKLSGNNVRNIIIEDLTLNFAPRESMDTPLRFIKVKGLTLSRMVLNGFYHRYDKNNETETIEGLKYHVAVFHDCTNVIVDGMTIRDCAPEGPFFHLCRKLQLNNIDISDVDNIDKRNLWSAIHFFYCTDVSLTHSAFRKRNMGPNSGSTINACCHNLSIDDCLFEGSKGVDFSNEMKEMDFSSENVTMTNSKILNSFYGIYTGPNPGLLKHLHFENCEFKIRVDKEKEGAVIYGQHVQDLSFKNCHLSGPIVLKIVSELQYSGKIGNYYFEDCTIDNDCYQAEHISKNRLVYAYNSDIDCGNVYLTNCSINYDDSILNMCSNWGRQLDVVIDNCFFIAYQMIYNDGKFEAGVEISNSKGRFVKSIKKGNTIFKGTNLEI